MSATPSFSFGWAGVEVLSISVCFATPSGAWEWPSWCVSHQWPRCECGCDHSGGEV